MSKINWLKIRKNLLFVNKKKQKTLLILFFAYNGLRTMYQDSIE